LEPIRDLFILAPSLLGVALVGDVILGGELVETATVGFGTQWAEFTEFFEPVTTAVQDFFSSFL